MRKSALLIAAMMIVAAPSIALAKKAAAPADPNAAGKKFVREAFSQPIYALQSVTQPKAAPAKAAKKPAKKAKKAKAKKS